MSNSDSDCSRNFQDVDEENLERRSESGKKSSSDQEVGEEASEEKDDNPLKSLSEDEYHAVEVALTAEEEAEKEGSEEDSDAPLVRWKTPKPVSTWGRRANNAKTPMLLDPLFNPGTTAKTSPSPSSSSHAVSSQKRGSQAVSSQKRGRARRVGMHADPSDADNSDKDNSDKEDNSDSSERKPKKRRRGTVSCSEKSQKERMKAAFQLARDTEKSRKDELGTQEELGRFYQLDAGVNPLRQRRVENRLSILKNAISLTKWRSRIQDNGIVEEMEYRNIPQTYHWKAPGKRAVCLQKCVVTGLPARYRDPKSGKPFANVQAYRELGSS